MVPDREEKGYRKTLLLGITGSVAAYKSADLARLFLKHDWRVLSVFSQNAEKFITPLTLSALTGEPAYTDLFGCQASDMLHIRLAEQADVCLVAPATANIIAKMAHGMADDLLTSLLLCFSGPVVVAPAMNTQMYRHTAVQRNCQLLEKEDVKIVNPVEGTLPCGTEGTGHIAENEMIFKAVQEVSS